MNELTDFVNATKYQNYGGLNSDRPTAVESYNS